MEVSEGSSVSILRAQEAWGVPRLTNLIPRVGPLKKDLAGLGGSGTVGRELRSELSG